MINANIGRQIIKGWWDLHPEIKTVLDVGAGTGSFRKFLGKKNWTAVEIWEPYVEKYGLRELYDRVIVDDARHTPLPHSDCIILDEILSLVDKVDALKLIEISKQNFHHAVIWVPIGKFESFVEKGGNPYKNHITSWDKKELDELTKGFEVKVLVPYSSSVPNLGIGVYIK